MKGSAADRLRGLPRQLTAVFAVMNAVGLIVFAWLFVRADAQRGEQRLDAELRRVTSSVARLIHYDGTVITVSVGEDEMYTGCPEFAVLPGRLEQFTGHFSQRDCVPVDRATLAGLAVEAVQDGRLLSGYVRGTDGELVRIGVEPFRNGNGQYIGAVVAVMDAGEERARHHMLIVTVIGGCLLLVAVVGAAGYLLSVRAVRPAVTALDQQEVLLADTAHDLRTPVAALRALAETALLNPTQRTELLPRTVELAKRMGGTIDGVLMRARLAAGVEPITIEPIWLDQLVATVVEETPTEGARVTLTTAPTKVNADPALIQRAIGNLLDNALRHGRAPGDEAVVHITVAGGRVIVADHGPGIDASVARETFDRFASAGGSSGLGLAIVRWVAQANGGTLRVYNGDEGGAIFELVLPDSDP